ncbi:hypothetical protein M405DRAFT_73973 [Rhizopogon salebrosus TDB-379]|nr:hypothetical protein M405DRAFT_73973 [Rhizopogon salebrosus TDB-379]
MHVDTNTGVVSSRKVTMAGLPHGSYGVLVLDTVGLSVSSGVIGHGLSIYCTCLHEWLRRMSHGCVNIWVARIYMPLPCTHLMRGVRIMRTIRFGKRVLTSRGVSTLPGSTLEGNRFPSPFDPRSTTHVRDVKRRSEQGEAIQS